METRPFISQFQLSGALSLAPLPLSEPPESGDGSSAHHPQGVTEVILGLPLHPRGRLSTPGRVHRGVNSSSPSLPEVLLIPFLGHLENAPNVITQD